MDYAKLGNEALDASDAHTAVGHFTQALVEHPYSPDYFTQRSTAFTRMKPARHDLALQDAEYAVVLGYKRQKREKIQAGQQRRVVSLYGLGRYEEAKQILDTMLKWRAKDSRKEKMEHDMWDARIAMKLKAKDAESQPMVAIKEFPDIQIPEVDALRKWLHSQLNSDGTFDFGENQGTTVQAPTLPNSEGTRKNDNRIDPQDEAEIAAAKAEMAAASQKESAQRPKPVRNDWYQDTNSVTITFYAKNVDKAKVQSEFTDDHVQLSFPHPEDPQESFTFTLDPTFASIDGSSSVAKAFGAKVELKLIKKDKGTKWAALDNKDRPKSDKLPSAWTTKGDQDWDKKAADLIKKDSKKKGKAKDDGNDDSDADSEFDGDAVDGFFKKLYAGADEDTRRAMMKSFQESNGTALSTNWAEVSKGKVEEVKGKDA